jgi:hypothetical protein
MANADIEATVGCEEQRRGYRYLAGRNHVTIDLIVMLSGPPGLGTTYVVSTSIFTLPSMAGSPVWAADPENPYCRAMAMRIASSGETR